MEGTLTRGEYNDTITLDWAPTVLHPNFITGIHVGSTYYPHPQSPLKITKTEPICKKISFQVKLAYGVTDGQGGNLCYSKMVEIPVGEPEEFFAMDREVSYERVQLSPNTYRVDWLKNMFRLPRYLECLYTAWDGNNLYWPKTKIFFVEMANCTETQLEYKFFKRFQRRSVFKTLKADCDETQSSTNGGGGYVVGGLLVFGVIAGILGGGVYVWRKKVQGQPTELYDPDRYL